jgi:hypothetical protein
MDDLHAANKSNRSDNQPRLFGREAHPNKVAEVNPMIFVALSDMRSNA